MRATLSTSFSTTRIRLKGWREVPRMVPPCTRIPEKSEGFIRW